MALDLHVSLLQVRRSVSLRIRKRGQSIQINADIHELLQYTVKNLAHGHELKKCSLPLRGSLEIARCTWRSVSSVFFFLFTKMVFKYYTWFILSSNLVLLIFLTPLKYKRVQFRLNVAHGHFFCISHLLDQRENLCSWMVLYLYVCISTHTCTQTHKCSSVFAICTRR